MADALIGYTGFVGSNLLGQHDFAHRFNSKNIEDIAGREFDLLICAGAPAAKWLANSKPDADATNLERLQAQLTRCRAERVILISTIDVYSRPFEVDEDTPINSAQSQPYGKHRYQLEQFVTAHFPRSHVLRLPALFGPGLKKNFIFDLLNNNCLDWTHKDSQFQFYDVGRLWSDCQVVLRAGVPLLNVATPPLVAGRIAAECFGIDFTNETAAPPVSYDMHTRHGALFGEPGAYIASQDECLRSLCDYVESARRNPA